MINEDNVEKTLDVSGLPCPIPSLRTRIEISKVSPGGILKVIATANNTNTSIPKFCQKNNHELILNFEDKGKHIFLIRKKIQ